MNFFIFSFINNDIIYNINGFIIRYIVIDRFMYNDFGCYLLFLKILFIFFFRINCSGKKYVWCKKLVIEGFYCVFIYFLVC